MHEGMSDRIFERHLRGISKSIFEGIKKKIYEKLHQRMSGDVSEEILGANP